MLVTKPTTKRRPRRMAWTKFPESPDLLSVSAGHEATGTRVPFTHWKVKVTWMSVSDISALLR